MLQCSLALCSLLSPQETGSGWLLAGYISEGVRGKVIPSFVVG